MSVKKLNENNFADEITNGSGLALVDFYADWCGPCKMLSPVVDEISDERSDISVGKVNVDENQSLAIMFGVMSIPCIVAFRDGKEIARSVGYTSKDEILEMFG